MPNIVGYGNTQIPTNAMLGDLAYQDSVGEIDLEKIKARTGDNATDIFVYDTRKDSDGGAWRHRTQNTSWYNEGVSAKRGARKEFPAVAVIVAAYENLTIYDGDDPNLPMWMDFDYGSSGLATITMLYANGKGASALNGVICSVGSAGWHDGLTAIDFIADNAKWRNSSYIAYWNNGIGNRNVAGGYGSFITAPNEIIVAAQVNDVAMTVLPNAPINPATGLPVPTIALATDGGTNIINDDGTVTQGYQTIATQNVDLHPAGYMTDGISGATNDSFSLYKIGTTTRVASYGHREGLHTITTFLNEGTGECLFEGSSNEIAIAQSEGLLRIEENLSNYTSGLHNRTTSSYNTGWMHGDIKGAFLSDTDDTNLTDTNLVTNGDFSNGSTGWSTHGVNVNTSGNNMVMTSSSGNQRISQAITVEPGQTYYFRETSSGNRSRYISTNTVSSGSLTNRNNSHFTVPAGTTTVYVVLYVIGTGNSATFDDIIVTKADPDRSVHNQPTNNGGQGLRVFGTVTKSAVATGAELVSYGPFTDSNYLKQPYYSDLNFGSDGFSFSIWIKPAANTPYMRIVNRVQDSNNRRWELYTDNGVNNIVFYTRDGSAASYVNVNDAIPLNTWTHVFAVREQNGNLKLYINGVLRSAESIGSSNNPAIRGLTSTTATLLVGNAVGWDDDNPFNGQLALLKISSSIPSAEQIKKIYNDEQCLYHKNAKCTLHGTSNDIKAIAYDDSNDILHVGTSAGRSEFQGLNRINNTTTAVTTAISASDGLVAEQ